MSSNEGKDGSDTGKKKEDRRTSNANEGKTENKVTTSCGTNAVDIGRI